LDSEQRALQPYLYLYTLQLANHKQRIDLLSLEKAKGNPLNGRGKVKQKERILALSFILSKAFVHTHMHKHEAPQIFCRSM
jgi:hypothetical protein